MRDCSRFSAPPALRRVLLGVLALLGALVYLAAACWAGPEQDLYAAIRTKEDRKVLSRADRPCLQVWASRTGAPVRLDSYTASTTSSVRRPSHPSTRGGLSSMMASSRSRN